MLSLISAKVRKSLLTFFSIFLLLGIMVWALLSANNGTVDPSNPYQPITNKGAIRIMNKELEDLDYEIFINNEETRLEDNSIRNLEPAKYTIRIVVPEYNTWETEVNVLAGMITEITPYLFAQDSNFQLKTTTPLNISQVFFSEYTDYAYFVVSKTNIGSEKGIWKIFLDDTSTIFSATNTAPIKILNIDPLLEKFVNEGNFELIPSPDESNLLFKTPTQSYIFTTDSLVSRNNKTLININELVGFNPQEMHWFEQGSSLVIKDNNLLAVLDVSSSTLNIITYNPAKAPIYAVNGDTIYYLDQTLNKIIEYKDNKKTPLTLENQVLPTVVNNIWVGKTSANYMILKSVEKYYYVDVEKSFIDLIGDNIEIKEFSADGKSLIYIKGNSVFSYFLDEINPINDYQPETRLILENFDKVTQDIKFNNKSSHILIYKELADGNRSIEVLEKNGQNKYELYRGGNLVGKYFSMIRSNKELVLLLQTDTFSNNTDSTQNLQKNNLYSRNLEV